jgi:hypothetical protein
LRFEILPSRLANGRRLSVRAELKLVAFESCRASRFCALCEESNVAFCERRLGCYGFRLKWKLKNYKVDALPRILAGKLKTKLAAGDERRGEKRDKPNKLLDVSAKQLRSF